ncbi:alpha/beta fold hydrolase [Janibacter melonis]|uniref:Alpha/beta fold hydrolase n=2 Tax=Janibacter melonis TaxID=262209 RepID=A0A5P8FIU7_9MICO|nr:alpha/beta fold hydrolase [Janibacter melonis]
MSSGSRHVGLPVGNVSVMATIEHTRLRGDGEPVVLVHGIGHRREAWGRLPALLHAAGHDVVVVDLPGFGRSGPPSAPDGWSMTSTAEQVERLAAELGLERPHVVGNSLGGLVALELAGRGSVRTAVALAPAGFASRRHLAVAASTLLALKAGSYLPQRVHRAVHRSPRLHAIAFWPLYTRPELVDPETSLGDTLALRTGRGFWPHLFGSRRHRVPRELAVPTTIAWGERDRLLLPAQAQTARERLPHAEHVLLPGCGHCPQVDDPDAVLAVATSTFARAADPAPSTS